ncbi:MAG: 2-iminoacetate synthase ThiH [Chitinivibrionales bacterium]|nr:2-iminoacetate synthase ThiH [Chitinivibrionales bacterium]
MEFYRKLQEFKSFNLQSYLDSIAPHHIEAILAKDNVTELDFPALLSDAALEYLEPMAQRAATITRKQFGNVIFLFTPLYISNYCENTCRYCSFACTHNIERRHLSPREIREEAQKIGDTGMRHILLLTGESSKKATLEYITDAVALCRDYFSSIGIEIYPLTEEGYGRCVAEGVDSLTIYQEVYDETIYHELHRGGPKDNYRFRLEAPDRACRQNVHSLTIGALLGLHDFRKEAFALALHLRHIQNTWPATEVSVSLPRIRPLVQDFALPDPVSDKRFVQLLTAFRIAFPSVGITISTRESKEFRNNILPLGVTRMSAGVSTAVGGHSQAPSTTQFEIADSRSLEEMKRDLLRAGFQPVTYDWNSRLLINS